MSKFKKKKSSGQQAISTASLPDIVFMLLFFFMVTTVLRETTIMVEQRIPPATQLTKLENKSLVSYIYIGKPKQTSLYGKEPRIQVNDVLISPEAVVNWVEQEKSKLSEAERDMITISLKIDRDAKMGIITDVKEQLREANARKINYSSSKKVDI
jgi:biopolymer transport protein ExbD